RRFRPDARPPPRRGRRLPRRCARRRCRGSVPRAPPRVTEHSTAAMSSSRVAMDIGGTVTHFVVVDGTDQGETSSGKVLTTPANPAEGVLDGLRRFVPAPSAIEFLVHGTTVGLNAFLERKGTRLLLIMTDGLRDSYSIARHDRKELYALRY